jgi:hypothetical protein
VVAELLLVRSMRSFMFVLLLAVGSLAVRGDLFTSYSAIGKMDDKHYEFTVSQGDILRTPIWAPDADFPPLSARKAQEIARREMQELLGTGKEQWLIRETTITDMGDGMHFVYAVQFEPPPGKAACTMCDFMRILVLMNGSVPKPIVKPLSP